MAGFLLALNGLANPGLAAPRSVRSFVAAEKPAVDNDPADDDAADNDPADNDAPTSRRQASQRPLCQQVLPLQLRRPVEAADAEEKKAEEKKKDDKPPQSKPAEAKPVKEKGPAAGANEIKPAKKPKAKTAAGVVINVKRMKPARQAQAAQLAQQWQPILLSELLFVRRMCPDLKPESRVRVKAAGEKVLEEAAATTVPTQFSGTSHQAMIREAISEALREELTPEEWKTFAVEAEARVKRRQTAVILVIVQHLDEMLYLSQEQREKIHQELVDRWKNGWEGWMQLRHMQGVPSLPDDIVVPFLDREQKDTWRKTAKMTLGNDFFLIHQMNNGDLGDTEWWDEAKPAGAEEASTDVPAP